MMNLSNPIGYVFPNGYRVMEVTIVAAATKARGAIGVLKARKDGSDMTTYVAATFTPHSLGHNEWVAGRYSFSKDLCNADYAALLANLSVGRSA